LFHMQLSRSVVNDATSGSGKVLSVARLEMAKYRTKCSKCRLWRIITVQLATLRGRSTNDSSVYSQTSCKKVERRGDTPSKTCKGVKLVCEGPREPQISDEAKSRTCLKSLPEAFFRSQEDVRIKEDVWSPYKVYLYI